MGTEYSYQEAGKWHADTIAYNDENELKMIGKAPQRITQIRIWSSEYIVGMEVFYDGISAGARMGSEFFKGVVFSDFILQPGEDIKTVVGRSGALIDQVGFKTTKGRKVSFGTSTGGKKFKLKDPAGRIVKGFKVGFGGHLHCIGVFFGHKNHSKPKPKPVPVPTPSPFPTPTPMPVPVPTPSPFPTPAPFPVPSPSSFPTPGYPSPTPVSIPAPKPVSIPTPTPVSIPTATPSWPSSTPSWPTSTPSWPTTTTSIPAPTPVSIPTPTPVSIPTPTPTWPSTAPAPTATWHTTTTTATPSWPTTTTTSTPAGWPSSTTTATWSTPTASTAATYTPPVTTHFVPTPVPVPAPVVATLTQSNVAGKVHGDTAQFDDFKTHKSMLKASSDVRVSELRVIHNNKYIFGIEVIYASGTKTISGGMHVGNEMDHTAVNQSVQLAFGETITGISGKHGDVIDSMTVTTSTGNIYKFGGSGGSFSYSLYIPPGKTVRSFAGGLGGHLHNISCYYS